METQTLREQNKSRLKLIMEDMPNRSGYAEKVVRQLDKKGVKVTMAMVYQTASGRTYNLEIIDTIAEVYEGILITEQQVNKRLNTVTQKQHADSYHY